MLKFNIYLVNDLGEGIDLRGVDIIFIETLKTGR